MASPPPSAVRLVESPAAAVRLDAARTFIEQWSPDRELLIVGASRDAADDLARTIAHRRGATFGLYRYNLIQLAAALTLAHTDAHATPATRLGTTAIAARVGSQALQEHALRYYAPVVPFPGFPGALARTIDELRLAAIEPAALERAAQGDVSDLLRRFLDQLAGHHIRDVAALLRMAADVASTDPPPPPLGHPLVLLDVAIESPAHEAFVVALLRRAPVALVTLASGDEPTRQTLAALAPAAPDPESGTASTIAAPPDDELAHLRAYVFSTAAPPQRERTGDVVLFSAPGEGRECIEIARWVLDEAESGVPFDRMAVLLRDPATYTPLLETALARAGIPAYFAHGTLRPDPAGRAFLTLLDCALERFSARRFAEYLAFGQVPRDPLAAPTDSDAWTPPEDEALGPAAGRAQAQEPSDEAGPEPNGAGDQPAPPQPGAAPHGGLRAPRKWEELLVESAVVGGADRWRRRLDGLAAELRLKLRELTRDPAGAARAAAVERDLGHLEHLRTFALPVIDRMGGFPEQATWGEWLPLFEGLAPLVLRQPERVLTILADLRPLGPVGPVRLAEVRAVLAPHLANLERRSPAHRYGRLFVGTLEQARGRSFDVVFAPGLAERIFPRKPREDPILLDDDRESLALPLVTQRDRSDHERFLLRLAVGAASRRLYLSYPRIDVDKGRPRVASFYALEVHRALTGRIPDPEALARAAADIGRTRLAWPAPEVPTYAIDAIEHDLATLRVLLDGPPEATRGRARYLLNLNGCLERSLRSRWRRWHRPWTPADGLVRATPEIQTALDAARLTARAYSVGMLEHFAHCPYRFLLLAIHRLEPREDPAPLEHLDPMTRGAIAHDVQAALMRDLQAARALPLAPARSADAMHRLDAALARIAEQYRDDLAPAIPRVWESEIAALRVDLRMWLECAITAHATWDPVAFELAFGIRPGDLVSTDPQSVANEVIVNGGYRIRGVVDLVERQRDGTVLRVTDHKTGKAKTPRLVVVGGGATLQPVLYALAVQHVFGAEVVEARLFYCTRAGQFEERIVRIAGTGAANRAQSVLETVDRSIAAGFLPPAPRPDACQFCDVRDACGPDEERRLTRKDPGPLADLQRMRSWP
jgi:ATP-dependent helicase/nuclease subunit B